MPNRAFRRIDEKDSTLFLWDIVVEFDLAIPARGLVDGEVVRPLEILIGGGQRGGVRRALVHLQAHARAVLEDSQVRAGFNPRLVRNQQGDTATGSVLDEEIAAHAAVDDVVGGDRKSTRLNSVTWPS